tara:strand:- start:53 stop:553 length:501 start_codon:yes stop_codon:yes gene_type:complete
VKIIIEPYNPNWANQFEKESELISQVLKDHSPIIEHIGSTSVKDLGAKPIIDILIGFPHFINLDKAVKEIQKLNYNYVPEYETTFPDRRFFYKTKKETRTHHIHLVKHNSDFWKKHIAFRNHLRENKVDMLAYNQLKIDLSKQNWEDRNDYTHAKSEFIQKIENSY